MPIKVDYLRQDKMKAYKSLKGPEKVKIALLIQSHDCEIGGQKKFENGSNVYVERDHWRVYKKVCSLDRRSLSILQYIKGHVVAVNSSRGQQAHLNSPLLG